MRSRIDAFESLATLLFGAWVGMGVQKVTEQHIGWLVWGLIGIPALAAWGFAFKLRWNETSRRERAEKEREKTEKEMRILDIKYPGLK